MKAVVIYESMYGNTHLIADAIAEGVGEQAEVTVVPVGRAEGPVLEDADLVVVGGPTHVHGMTRASTRKAAIEATQQPDKGLVLDADAEGEGLRDWFEKLAPLKARAAAFDTRINAPAPVTGRASKGIAKRLRHHGCELVVGPESFLVTKDNHLEPDEATRARQWGAQLVAAMTRTA